MKIKSLPLIIFAVLILFVGCKKEQDEIGLDLQDANLLGNSFVDTLTIDAYSLPQDSVSTKNLAQCVVGYVNDPVFGRTRAGFCTQFDLSGSNINFGTEPVLDSVVLTLQYNGYFGDTTSALTIRVYELSEALNSSDAYYATSTTAHQSENLTYQSDFTVAPRPSTKVLLDSTSEAAHLRIRLKDNFGIQRLLQNPGLTDNSSFQSNFKGLYIVAENANGTGNLFYTNPLSSITGLTLYYHNNRKASQKYTFSISSSNCTYYTQFNHFNYGNATSDFRSQVLNGNRNLGKEVLYLQGTSGVMARLNFPYLKNSFPKNVIVNKAELVISNISSDPAYFFVPADLGLQAVKSDGTIGYLPDDEVYTSSSYFGGEYDSDNNEYRFRITKYVQNELLVLNDLSGINLVVNGAGIHANRLILCGPQPGAASYAKRLRLEIYYTTY